MHAQNIGAQEFLLREFKDGFDSGIVKKLKKFQHWEKRLFHKKTCTQQPASDLARICRRGYEGAMSVQMKNFARASSEIDFESYIFIFSSSFRNIQNSVK